MVAGAFFLQTRAAKDSFNDVALWMPSATKQKSNLHVQIFQNTKLVERHVKATQDKFNLGYI